MRSRDDSATVQLKIRIREPLRAAIAKDADTEATTMNAVIADRLTKSFTAEKSRGGAASTRFFDRLETKILTMFEPDFDFAANPEALNYILNKFPELAEEFRPPLSALAQLKIDEGKKARQRLQDPDATEQQKRDAQAILYVTATDPTLPLSVLEEFTRILPPGIRETVRASRLPLAGAMTVQRLPSTED